MLSCFRTRRAAVELTVLAADVTGSLDRPVNELVNLAAAEVTAVAVLATAVGTAASVVEREL